MESVGYSYMFYGNANYFILKQWIHYAAHHININGEENSLIVGDALLLPMVDTDSKVRTDSEVDLSLEVTPVFSSVDDVSVENGAVYRQLQVTLTQHA